MAQFNPNQLNLMFLLRVDFAPRHQIRPVGALAVEVAVIDHFVSSRLSSEEIGLEVRGQASVAVDDVDCDGVEL